MMYVLLGFAAFFNFAVILHKLHKDRYLDAIFDVTALILLNMIFLGSFGGAVTATIASSLMSLYLYFAPLKFLKID